MYALNKFQICSIAKKSERTYNSPVDEAVHNFDSGKAGKLVKCFVEMRARMEYFYPRLSSQNNDT